MRILLTGHRGFIGGHLMRELKAGGHEVYGADIEAGTNLSSPGTVHRVFQSVGPDQVIHLAAQVGRVFGERDARHTVTANALVTTLLAQVAGERRVPVLYASSSEVYGDQGAWECREDTTPVQPHNLYGLTKRWGEEVLRLYAPAGLQIVRLSMPYGPGAPPGVGRRALDNILWQAHHGKPIPIHRGAERSWCWIEDTTKAIRLILECGERDNVTHDPAKCVYNVGRDDAAISMLDLALRCIKLARADQALIELVDPPARQTVVKRLSTAKLRRLGWSPRVELEEGLPQVLEWVTRFDAAGDFIG